MLDSVTTPLGFREWSEIFLLKGSSSSVKGGGSNVFLFLERVV